MEFLGPILAKLHKIPPTSTHSHYVENGLRGLTAATTGSSGRGTLSIGMGSYRGPLEWPPMVRRFNQHPLKKLKLSKLVQNQNEHQKQIPQVKTKHMSGRTSELHRV